MSEFLSAAKAIAQEVGKYQLAELGRKHQVKFKGRIDIVTEVDQESEKRLIAYLTNAFPTHGILAEEGGGLANNSAYKWIIDPLDGTINFSHGYPLFAVSLALEYQGEIIVGVVYEPNHDELFWAEKGKGSFVNGRSIHVSKINQLGHAIVVTGFPYNIRETINQHIGPFARMLGQAQAVRRDGAASTDLCYIAMGRFQGLWESNLKSWDVAAGALILTEAGGCVSNYSGEKFSVYANEILASNGFIHEEMIRVLGDRS